MMITAGVFLLLGAGFPLAQLRLSLFFFVPVLAHLVTGNARLLLCQRREGVEDAALSV